MADLVRICFDDYCSTVPQLDTTLSRSGYAADAGAVGTALAGKAPIAAIGSPLVATTAAGMTDRTKVYVYTGSETGYTSGHWYYWNGSAWADGGVYQATGINTDTTLSIAGMAADAKATGDEITELKNDLSQVETDLFNTQADVEDLLNSSGLTEDIKTALLTCFRNVAWINEDGETYYTALYNALYSTVESISAVYTQSGTVYDTDELSILRQNLVVTATYKSGSTAEVSTYTLSGSLVSGTSTITVTYNGKTTTFTVTVTHRVATLTSIAAVVDPNAVIYNNNTLEDLKQYLTVTATYSDDSTSSVDAYTLDGTLSAGTSIITVTYNNVSTTVDVAVSDFVSNISANYAPNGHIIHTSDSLDVLKQYLTVTANYADGTSGAISDYSLNGTLEEGNNNIVISYSTRNTQISVIASSDSNYLYSLPSGTVLTGSNRFDTGYVPENNNPVSIVVDATDTVVLSRTRTLYLVTNHTSGSDSPVTIGFSSTSDSGTYLKQYYITSNNSLSQKSATQSNGTHRIKVALIREDENTIIIYMKVDDTVVFDGTSISPVSGVTASAYPLYIGGCPTGGYNWEGTVNLANIYSRALTLPEAKALLEEE